MNYLVKNVKFSLLNYMIINILRFLVRYIFIYTLSIEYLGINGLFSNILSVLSLVELGIGPAIIYSLYKPLAERNIEETKSIMSLFKKTYICVGIIILLIGLCIYPYLDFFIKDKPNIEGLSNFYLIFLLNTAISYFWSYKRNLLIADQKQYIVNIYQIYIQIVISIIQIFILIIVSNYYLYIITMLVGTICENIFISRKAEKEYPYLKEKSYPLSKKVKKEIIKNIKAMILHKISSVIILSTSNIILSKFVGLAVVGLYSNYYIILMAINTIFNKFFEAITASIGNLMITKESKNKIEIFKKMQFLLAFLTSIVCIGLYILLNPFISLWLGREYTFDQYVVTCMVISLYLTYMRLAVLMFRNACGLFWYDRYKAILEVIVNIIASIYFTNLYGILGIIYGNIISTLLICFWIEPYVLFKYGIRYSLKKYFIDYFMYSVVSVLGCIIIYFICQLTNKFNEILNFILNLCIIFLGTNLLWYYIFKNRLEYVFFKDRFYKKISTIKILRRFL